MRSRATEVLDHRRHESPAAPLRIQILIAQDQRSSALCSPLRGYQECAGVAQVKQVRLERELTVPGMTDGWS